MGSVLKFIYDNRILINGTDQILLNGVHPAVIAYVKKRANEEKSVQAVCNEIRSYNQSSSWDSFFRHANLLGYYQRRNPDNKNLIRIDEIVDDGAIYLYPIEVATMLSDLYTPQQVTIENIVYNYHFLETLDPRVLRHLKSGKVKLLLNLIHDPIESPSMLINIEKYLTRYGVDPINCIVISGNNYQDYYKENPTGRIKITSGFIVLGQPAFDMKDYPRIGALGYECDFVRETDLDSTKIRPKKFLCFNRNMRSHRVVLSYLAVKYNLLENSIFSFVVRNDGPGLNHTSVFGDVFKLLDSSPNVDLCKKAFDVVPLEIDTQHLLQHQKNGFTTNNNKKEFYMDTYFHITSETSFVGDTKNPFFSEKTFHPIVNLQPFIFVGNAYSLKQLQVFGFKTFHPYIDETYDQVENPKERFKLIEKEIAKLAELSHQELHDLYYQLVDIVIYNQNLLKNYINYYPFETAMDDIKKFYAK
jgi:hypothetical protein